MTRMILPAISTFICIAAVSLTAPGSAEGQATASGALQGQIVANDGRPVAGATIVAEATELSIDFSSTRAATSDENGNYRIVGLLPGTYRVYAILGRYVIATPIFVTVRLDQPAVVNLQASQSRSSGEVIVVTGTRLPDRLSETPAAIQSLDSDDIDQIGGISYIESLKGNSAVDFASSGLLDQRLSARGFDSHFNNRMLWIIDGRTTSGVLGTQPGNTLPSPTLDLKGIETLVGPASAQYGPNAHTGVVNMLTKSPWDQSGASIATRGGTRSFVDGSLRVAGTVRDRIGWKVTGQLLRAEDFKPDCATHTYGESICERDLLGDYDVGLAKVEGSLYYRHDGWNARGSYGFSQFDGFSLTSGGRFHVRNGRKQYQHIQVSHSNWFAQFTRNETDVGDSYPLDRLATTVEASVADGGSASLEAIDMIREDITPDGIDPSQDLEADLHYRNRFGPLRTAVGAQWRMNLPVSPVLADPRGGDLETMEIGGFIEADYELLPDRLRLFAATRVDSHSNYSTQISPKAAAIYTIASKHRIRASYNRAYKSPSTGENYLALPVPFIIGNRYGYTISDAEGTVISEIPRLEPEEADVVEIGYKGQILDRIFIDATLYNAWYENFISPLTLLANPMMGTFASHAGGGPVADGTPFAGSLLSYINYGESTVRGADIAVTADPNPYLSLSAGVSWISLVDFSEEDIVQEELLLNVPEWKATASITARNLGLDNYFVRLSGRFRNAFEFESGYWSSQALLPDAEMPSRFVSDLTMGYDLPRYGVAVRAYVGNLFNNKDVEILGGPVPRRFTYLQLAYTYHGLDL